MKWLGPEVGPGRGFFVTRLWAGLLRKAGTPAAVSRGGFHAQGRLREKETLLWILGGGLLQATPGKKGFPSFACFPPRVLKHDTARYSDEWCNSRNDLYFSCAVKSPILTSRDHRVQVTSYLELRWWGPSVKLADMSPEVGHPTAGWSPVFGAGLPAAAKETLRSENEESERENQPMIKSKTLDTLLRYLVSPLALRLKEKV